MYCPACMGYLTDNKYYSASSKYVCFWDLNNSWKLLHFQCEWETTSWTSLSGSMVSFPFYRSILSFIPFFNHSEKRNDIPSFSLKNSLSERVVNWKMYKSFVKRMVVNRCKLFIFSILFWFAERSSIQAFSFTFLKFFWTSKSTLFVQ